MRLPIKIYEVHKMSEWHTGKKTLTGLVLSVLLGLASAWGVSIDQTLVDTVSTMAVGLIGYGFYDKLGRK